MSLGLGQIFVILLVLVLLFGNLPKMLKDLASGIKIFKKTIEEPEDPKKSEKE